VVNRDAAFVIFAVSSVSKQESNQQRESGVELMNRLAPWPASRKTTCNFRTPADATVQGTRMAFDDCTYTRLQGVKARYDPRNMFRLYHNIPPDSDRVL
jgi:hypothetical protein